MWEKKSTDDVFKNKNNLVSFSSDFIDHTTIKEHANSDSIIFSKFLNFAQQ